VQLDGDATRDEWVEFFSKQMTEFQEEYGL